MNFIGIGYIWALQRAGYHVRVGCDWDINFALNGYQRKGATNDEVMESWRAECRVREVRV